VISTSGGALPEVVGDAGIIVPPGDKEVLERAILYLLDHPEKRRELGQAGLKPGGKRLYLAPCRPENGGRLTGKPSDAHG